MSSFGGELARSRAQLTHFVTRAARVAASPTPFSFAGAEDEALDLLARLLLRLPARGVVGAEHRSLDDGARLLLERQRQRVVEQPADAAAGVRDRARDCRGGGSQRVGVDLAGLADPGHDDAACLQLAVGVEEDGLAELAVQLAALGQALQAAGELLVEDACALRQGIALGEDDGERVGLGLARQFDFDSDLVHVARARIAEEPSESSRLGAAVREGFYGVFTNAG